MDVAIVFLVFITIILIIETIRRGIKIFFLEPARLRELKVFEKKQENIFEEKKVEYRSLLNIKEKEWKISIEPYSEKYFDLKKDISEMLREQFLVSSCSSCNENIMSFESISPTGKSITYICDHCNKKTRASSINKDSALIVEYINELKELSLTLRRLQNNYEKELYEVMGLDPYYCPPEITEDEISIKDYLYRIINASFSQEKLGSKTLNDQRDRWHEILFHTPEAVMSYDQTNREVIPESIRSLVWRRDLGSCAVCESKENLQFDHIIPVSKGGATSALNLQLLCRSCNQIKGAKI